jgi:hypothetical protein
MPKGTVITWHGGGYSFRYPNGVTHVSQTVGDMAPAAPAPPVIQ